MCHLSVQVEEKNGNSAISHKFRKPEQFLNATFLLTLQRPTEREIQQIQKYTWLIDTIRRAGKISLEEISDRWERNKDLSDYKPLSRATFNRWKDAIFSQFGIIISCQRAGGYLYYIENPEAIEEDGLRKWMLNSFAVSNLIHENYSLKDRVLVPQIPSAHRHLDKLFEAMRENRVVAIIRMNERNKRQRTWFATEVVLAFPSKVLSFVGLFLALLAVKSHFMPNFAAF